MMEVVLVVARFAQFSAGIVLLGTSVFLLGLEPAETSIPEIRRAFRRWQRPVFISAAAIALASSLAWLDIEAGTMGGSWSDAADLRTLSTVLFQTEFGHVWVWNMASAIVLFVGLSMPRAREQATLSTVLVAGLSAVLVASSASTGHAVMHSGFPGAVQLTVQVIHVLAASLWLGSLPALAFALHHVRVGGQAEWRNAVRYILPRYSQMGYLAVGLILVTGCLSSWFMLDSIDALFSTTYGRILLAKIGLVGLMVGVAIVNRLILTPKILETESHTLTAEVPFQRLWRNVAIEQCVGLSIIAVVSVLGTIAPAMSGQMEM